MLLFLLIRPFHIEKTIKKRKKLRLREAHYIVESHTVSEWYFKFKSGSKLRFFYLVTSHFSNIHQYWHIQIPLDWNVHWRSPLWCLTLSMGQRENAKDGGTLRSVLARDNTGQVAQPKHSHWWHLLLIHKSQSKSWKSCLNTNTPRGRGSSSCETHCSSGSVSWLNHSEAILSPAVQSLTTILFL